MTALIEQSGQKANAIGAESVDAALDILVLDDSEFDLRRIERLLQGLNLEVRIHTCSTIEAFEVALDENIFDVCLIDHRLSGGVSGNDALEIVRAHKSNGYVPAILISGMTDPKLIANSIQSGFANFVDKDGLNVSRLSRVVADALDEASHGSLSERKRYRLLSRILREVAQTYADSTRPHLMEIYRKVDFMRKCLAQNSLPDPQALDDIEERCFEIWRFLDNYPNNSLGLTGKIQ